MVHALDIDAAVSDGTDAESNTLSVIESDAQFASKSAAVVSHRKPCGMIAALTTLAATRKRASAFFDALPTSPTPKRNSAGVSSTSSTDVDAVIFDSVAVAAADRFLS